MILFLSSAAYALDRNNYPERIVSLGPSVTEELYLLGAEDRLVGVTNYCIRPQQAQRKQKVGAVIEVNLERIVDLKPDLIIATSLTNLKAVATLKNLGLRVITIPQPKDFTDICRQLLELGEVVGKKREALVIISKAESEMYHIKKKVSNLPKRSVFVEVGAKPLVTIASGSFINNLIELGGGINIAENSRDDSYMPYSREKVLKSDPDCIIIVTMGIAGEEEKSVWETFKSLKAVKNDRIHVIDSYKFCSLTPITFVESLKDIAGILHPENRAGVKR